MKVRQPCIVFYIAKQLQCTRVLISCAVSDLLRGTFFTPPLATTTFFGVCQITFQNPSELATLEYAFADVVRIYDVERATRNPFV